MKNLDGSILGATQKVVNYLSSKGVDTVVVGQQLSIFMFIDAFISQIISIVHVSNDIGFHHWSDVVANIFMTLISIVGLFFTSIFSLMLYQSYNQAYTSPRMPFPSQFRVFFLILTPVFFVVTIQHILKTHIRTVDILDILRILIVLPTIYGAFCFHFPPTRRRKQKAENFKMA